MTTHRLDAIARTLAARRSRRAALQTAGAGLVAGLASVAGPGARAQATVSDGATASFLFVQTATAGVFNATPDGAAPYRLTLTGHHGGTIYFSDRPERRFGETATGKFLDGLGFSPADPPNAALLIQTAGDEPDVAILELLNPTYDEATGTLAYDAAILAEYEEGGLADAASQQQDAELPETFGRASLFIDSCAAFAQCAAWSPGLEFPGSIPGGPYPACWSAQKNQCAPCDSGTTYGDLVGLCNQTYSVCRETGGCLPMGG